MASRVLNELKCRTLHVWVPLERTRV